MNIQRLSIELTNQCSKKCHFCYNSSHPTGHTAWTPDELTGLVSDCAKSGTQAVSFGGGEPLEYPGVFEVLQRSQGILFRSITSNGLPPISWIDKYEISNPKSYDLLGFYNTH